MMVQMLGVFAEFERATIIDRVISGMERKAARGEWTAGSPPYGYVVDPATKCFVVDEATAALVPVVFDLYVTKHIGARSIAAWLNDRGHRTRAGRPFSHMAVLTILRNRAYVGEIYFRGSYHAASHPTLVDPEVFSQAQELLVARGEDYSKRASNSSDYLLSGFIVCASCGKHFVGTAAKGNKYRYRYYTCFSRQRYGVDTCKAERLPADELDDAILAALLDLYESSDIFDKAA